MYIVVYIRLTQEAHSLELKFVVGAITHQISYHLVVVVMVWKFLASDL